MTHTCHAIDCEMPVPPDLLMCIFHWRRVPRHLRKAVTDAYRTGQEVTKDPSATWLLAAERAICVVAVRDRLMTGPEAEAKISKLKTLLRDKLEIEQQYEEDMRAQRREMFARPANPTTVVTLRGDLLSLPDGGPDLVYVARGSKYGNPYTGPGVTSSFKNTIPAATAEEAVANYRTWLTTSLELPGWTKPTPFEVYQLRGKRLGCYCEVGTPCHARVLAELAENDGRDVYDNDIPF